MDASGRRIGGWNCVAAPPGSAFVCWLLLGALWTGLPSARADEAPAASRSSEPVRFNRDIRPILSEHCFTCHGPDARQRRAGLRLDLEAAARGELESGLRAIVAGQPQESELMARVASGDPSERMPPPSTGKVLSPAQIELLKRWIEQGAPWEGHWSLQPIGRPVPPTISAPTGTADDEPGFVCNPIDAFVLAGQRAHGLSPAPEADRVTLLRRVYSDLIGLPPTWDEVAEFLADQAPDAYERVVDRLLASPHFGERMAIVWLDLVRYADSVGLYADQEVRVAPYRDYVIDAFNRNLPFDRFTIEQLAGDLLPDRTQNQQIAAAYNRLGRMSTESGVQEKEYLAKYAGERVRNLGTTWLGLTLGCCECHDHKFDPLRARDFYRLGAYFADIKERGVYDKAGPVGIDWGPTLHLGTPAQLEELTKLIDDVSKTSEEIEEHKKTCREPTPELEAEQAAWERSLEHARDWRKLQPVSVVSTARASCRILPDKSILVGGVRAETDTYVIRARVPLTKFTAIRLEAMTDVTLPSQGPGRGPGGNFVVTGFSVSIDQGAKAPTPVPFRSASASFEQTDAPGDIVSRIWSANSILKPDPKHPELGWSIADRAGSPQEAIFETSSDMLCSAGAELTITIRHDSGDKQALGRFRLSVADAPRPVQVFGYGLPERIRQVLSQAAWRRTKIEKQDVSDYFATNVSTAGRGLGDRINKLQGRRDHLNAVIPSVLIVERVEPRPIRVLKRGDWQDETGELVEPGVPAALPQTAAREGRGTRLDLAEWIVSPENPLPARVLANRLWKLGFGTGLSRKVDDLGSQGEWPTHPELLDWLAGQLIDSGWDIKHTLRLIVTSGTYRQSSLPSEESRQRDPENRWWSRQARFRLDAELIRDNALAVSGLLAPQLGGESVRPYQPDGFWDLLNKPPRVWTETAGNGVYRRGLYVHWQRQYLHPMLSAFDAPSREECAAERPRSNTPMQALVLLNDPTFVEAARVLATRALSEGGESTADRVRWLYREILSRPPQPEEQEVLAGLFERHLARYRLQPAAAIELLRVGRSPAPPGDDIVQLAAWTNLARVVLNLHDAVIRK